MARAPRKQDADETSVATSDSPRPDPVYTRQWRVSHPYFGSRTFLAETAGEARGQYAQLCGDGDLATEAQCCELEFVPAATERDKPHGWLASAD